ncbi:uncharacterized protein LOC108908497 [Anoplophora glabripennis]|uniref:uncharacterized protein LOC108908497 n=1 Tax=Anoplophora glabripennis TaxID=217634 RepID=UPI000874B0EB|nr:uncharacterized protein LOC108908497 [Anoplophora glabripennis]
MSKEVSFFVLVLIVAITGYQEKFVLENKITGKVLGGEGQSFGQEEDWEHGNWQLWNLEPRSNAGYSVLRNVASGIVITYPKNRSEYQLWNVNTNGDTWIQLNRYVLILNKTALYFTFRENDERDRWFLMAHSKKNDTGYDIVPRSDVK